MYNVHDLPIANLRKLLTQNVRGAGYTQSIKNIFKLSKIIWYLIQVYGKSGMLNTKQLKITKNVKIEHCKIIMLLHVRIELIVFDFSFMKRKLSCCIFRSTRHTSFCQRQHLTSLLGPVEVLTLIVLFVIQVRSILVVIYLSNVRSGH